jgi:hypothetical protein
MSQQNAKGQPGAAWSAFVRSNGSAEFETAFSEDATLQASALERPLVGAKEIGTFFAATSGGMYEKLSFESEATAGAATYYQWAGRAFGLDLRGVTVVTRDADGKIQSIRLFHSPYPVVVKFADELAKHMARRTDGPTSMRAPELR